MMPNNFKSNMKDLENLISEIYHKIPKNEESSEECVENTRQEFMAFMHSSIMDEAKLWMRASQHYGLCDEYDAYASQEVRMDLKVFQQFILTMLESKAQKA